MSLSATAVHSTPPGAAAPGRSTLNEFWES